MIQKAFKVRVFPERVKELAKRHNPIRSELEQILKEHGVYDNRLH